MIKVADLSPIHFQKQCHRWYVRIQILVFGVWLWFRAKSTTLMMGYYGKTALNAIWGFNQERGGYCTLWFQYPQLAIMSFWHGRDHLAFDSRFWGLIRRLPKLCLCCSCRKFLFFANAFQRPKVIPKPLTLRTLQWKGLNLYSRGPGHSHFWGVRIFREATFLGSFYQKCQTRSHIIANPARAFC